MLQGEQAFYPKHYYQFFKVNGSKLFLSFGINNALFTYSYINLYQNGKKVYASFDFLKFQESFKNLNCYTDKY